MCRRKKSVRKIYKTTDGLFNSRPEIKKPRRVAAIDQRKDDGALAVVKIYSKKDKSGKYIIDKLVLTPDKHSSLTEDSVIGNQVIFGVKDGNKFIPIYERDLKDTGDKLTRKEHKKVKQGVANDTTQHRRTYRKKKIAGKPSRLTNKRPAAAVKQAAGW